MREEKLKELENVVESYLSQLSKNFDNIDFNYIYFKNLMESRYPVDYVEEFINEETNDYFIYYADAMEYLSKNDNSLLDSLEIVYDMGYSLESINSTLLANVLYRQNIIADFSDYYNEVEDFLNTAVEAYELDEDDDEYLTTFNELMEQLKDYID